MAPAKAQLARPPLDKRPDFGKILGVSLLLTTITGMLNGVAVSELGTPVGYTSGPCVNAGRFLANKDPTASKILGIIIMFYVGGIIVGATGSEGDQLFEGQTSLGMLFSSALLVLGTYTKKSLNMPFLTTQLWALSQGWMNGVSSKFSAAPIRATHTAGGQTDAAISVGQMLAAIAKGQPPSGSMRKIILNAVCCAGMVLGGFISVKIHKRMGTLAALVPAAALAAGGAAMPRMIAPASKEDADD
mmetsp:Transcript_18052/g.42178  ORF Transcript_18052/g.42178 Transcript_18052/m.42178 type:complete len:245 (-) Transcript_18052:125-859(-)|eukprot:CAMPEP_0178422144 /NCGR_PEP_ID=MMETSP0689_2-20121128/27020_1 /TAXON_ID=160604 /ORGANISM="Amphidinium massartii, Strain CS-259" /LENGTH=244 /DNA_ID=CAMNT_0020043695 /DNA_START=68 /DNA_END=802 /DNA_ORIENTATION=+